jgi:hypothetical protein
MMGRAGNAWFSSAQESRRDPAAFPYILSRHRILAGVID